MKFRKGLAAALLSCLMSFEALAGVQSQPGLRIIVIDGAGAINDIERGAGRNPVVEVRDENGAPVAGAKLTFSVPERGPSGTFFGAGTNLNVTTNEQGRATGAGFRPNLTAGRFMIRVTAVQGDRIATANIAQSNVESSAAAQNVVQPKKFWQRKVFAVIVAGALAGAIVASRGGDESPATTVPGTTITPGTVSVGTPR